MSKLTPMMAQYKQVKAQYPDCILMFRLGDFFEMFFEDALEASKILQITLTARNREKDLKIPMCGIPYHAVDNYLAKLTRAGKKVALCDQITAADGKNLVQREVVRVVTPGTTFDENILEQKANNYVCAIVADGNGFALAYSDVTTGEFKVTEANDLKDLSAELMRISAAECILEESLMKKLESFLKNFRGMSVFVYEFKREAENLLKDHFKLQSLKVFDLDGRILAAEAAGMLFQYLKDTQKTDLKHITKISYFKGGNFMPLDSSSIRNLELLYNNHDGRSEASLLWVLDQTVNPMGGRLMRKCIIKPLISKNEIEARLNKVEIFVKDASLLSVVREKLERIYDIERLLSRLSLGTGNARDLVAMKKSLKIVPELKVLIENVLPTLAERVEDMSKLVEVISKAINEQPPMSVREGGMILDGFNSELDTLRSISGKGKGYLMELQQRESKRTGIGSLKVKFNCVFGYYIEISKTNLSAVPQDYIRKQTLVNAERFITPELKEYEEKVLTAEERIKTLEYEIFYDVRMQVVQEIVKIQKIAEALSQLDVLSALAFLAVKNNYCKPEILEDETLEIIEGRHCVLEMLGKDFIYNDCKFENGRKFLLITGPNMGGKSTYLRQTALIVLMAQIGSYVPCKSARIGLVDRIFTRVGASDNLSKGESTFMVEMQEASYILNNATSKSLIILDEIGRGTSTYDGVSIAWAMMEFLHDSVGARTLFATHYHELIELADKLSKAANLSVAVRENAHEGVVFLYKIVEGGVDKSYGIEVAKLAGLPSEVVNRARGVLKELEERQIKKAMVNPDQIGMFGGEPNDLLRHAGMNERERGILKELEEIDVNKITPLEAMQKLNEMKKKDNDN